MPQFGASLTDDSRGIIYNCYVFIIQYTVLEKNAIGLDSKWLWKSAYTGRSTVGIPTRGGVVTAVSCIEQAGGTVHLVVTVIITNPSCATVSTGCPNATLQRKKKIFVKFPCRMTLKVVNVNKLFLQTLRSWSKARKCRHHCRLRKSLKLEWKKLIN